jgi:hypothetical protein
MRFYTKEEINLRNDFARAGEPDQGSLFIRRSAPASSPLHKPPPHWPNQTRFCHIQPPQSLGIRANFTREVQEPHPLFIRPPLTF